MGREEVYIGKDVDSLYFDNIENTSWGKPTIYYNKWVFLGQRRVELSEWQISSLVNAVIKYVKALEKYQKNDAKDLEKDKEELLKLVKKISEK